MNAAKKHNGIKHNDIDGDKAALKSAFSKSLTIAAIVGIGLALVLLALFGVTDYLPAGEAAESHWRQGRFNLPIAIIMATFAPSITFILLAVCLRRWQSKLWPFSLALIGLICPLIWFHGLVILDLFKFNGALAMGNLYLPPYAIFWSSAVLMFALLFLGLIISKIRAMVSRSGRLDH